MDALLAHVRYRRRRACSFLASSSMPAQGVGEGRGELADRDGGAQDPTMGRWCGVRPPAGPLSLPRVGEELEDAGRAQNPAASRHMSVRMRGGREGGAARVGR
jgi:hypothetical protein